MRGSPLPDRTLARAFVSQLGCFKKGRGLTMRELATVTGVSRHTLRAWFDETRSPKRAACASVAARLHLDLDVPPERAHGRSKKAKIWPLLKRYRDAVTACPAQAADVLREVAAGTYRILRTYPLPVKLAMEAVGARETLVLRFPLPHPAPDSLYVLHLYGEGGKVMAVFTLTGSGPAPRETLLMQGVFSLELLGRITAHLSRLRANHVREVAGAASSWDIFSGVAGGCSVLS